MLKLGKTAMIAAIALSVLGTAAMAGAKDDDGGAGAGGFVISGSTDGVNPAYHQDIFGNSNRAVASHAQAKVTAHRPATRTTDTTERIPLERTGYAQLLRDVCSAPARQALSESSLSTRLREGKLFSGMR